MIAFEGFSQMLLNFLRIPPGSSFRGASGKNSVSGDGLEQVVRNSEYIQSVVDISLDDICLGNQPLYYKSNDNASDEVIAKVKDVLLPAFNKVIRWACRDLQCVGFSVYEPKLIKGKKTTDSRGREVIVKDKFIVVPVLDDLEFYLSDSMDLVVYKAGELLNIDDALIFINYDKSSLETVEDSDKKDNNLQFKVKPTPMQLKNVANTAASAASAEKSILRYRQQLSRIVRFLSVDVGISQGEKQQEVLDNISNAINSDSDTIQEMSSFNMYNDEIPIIPTRKGIGKPEYTEAIPSADIGNLADLDRTYSKLNMQLRFPKTYSDFNQALGETAASTIRGDVRYNRMITAIRTNLEDTINEYLHKNKDLKANGVTFALSELPTPENADVLDTLNSFSSFSSDLYDFIFSGVEDAREASFKKSMIQDLLGGSANLKFLQKFFETIEQYIKIKFGEMPSMDEDNEEDFGEDAFEHPEEESEEPEKPEESEEPEKPEESEEPEKPETEAPEAPANEPSNNEAPEAPAE